MKHLSTSNQTIASVYLVALGMLFAAVALGILLGATNLSSLDLARVIWRRDWDSPTGRIFWYVRLPRVLGSLLCGGALAVSGAMPMLEIRHLRGGYGAKTVLQDVSMDAQAGQITAILGPNGCGKSTLLKTICGILPAAAGQVRLDEQNLVGLPSIQTAQKVAYLAQNRQVPDITVGRLVLHGRFPYLSYPRRYRAEDLAAARQAMERMGILELKEEPLSRLSGGQRQKAYIAMALAQDTSVILLDEPTTYLDVAHQMQMLGQARELARAGKHVVMVIHDLTHALQIADQVVLMTNGRMIMQGTPEGIFESGALETAFGVQVARVQIGGKWHYFCISS